MDARRKAELKQAYKQSSRQKGVFKITCAATEETWADASTSLESIQNRIWFTLRMGTHRNVALQKAWNEAGAEAMTFAIVEVFPDDVTGLALEGLLKARKAHWLDALGAEPCL